MLKQSRSDKEQVLKSLADGSMTFEDLIAPKIYIVNKLKDGTWKVPHPDRILTEDQYQAWKQSRTEGKRDSISVIVFEEILNYDDGNGLFEPSSIEWKAVTREAVNDTVVILPVRKAPPKPLKQYERVDKKPEPVFTEPIKKKAPIKTEQFEEIEHEVIVPKTSGRLSEYGETWAISGKRIYSQ